ncbi:MAG: HK97 gp10 family phage protein [Oscillospiraceae bacterium]|nr:HK97 gp10 family phage protein [Oscillospiraceae bacterium]
MSRKVSVDRMAEEISDLLQEYAGLAADEMKTAVKKAGETTRKDIRANAPAKTGKYAKSWRSKTTKEDSSSLQVTVYSPSRYRIAHLLEHGHAKRGGGRVKAYPHIAPAEEAAEEQLVNDITKALEKG